MRKNKNNHNKTKTWNYNMKKIIIAVLLMAGSSVAWADTPSYSLIELNYSVTDINGFDENSRTVSIGGAIEVSDHTFIAASYGTNDNDGLEDQRHRTVGVGYFSPIGDDTSWHTAIHYVGYKIDRYHDDDGLIWQGGVRKNVSKSFELYGHINAQYLNYYGTQVGLVTGAVFHMPCGLGLDLGLSFNDDNSSSVTAGVLYTF